jgi:hypothetical protein
VRYATVFVVCAAAVLAFAVPRAPAYVDPRLVPQVSVPGIIFDVSTTTLLYLEVRTRQLVLLDRATSLAVTVPRVPGGFWPVHGFLGGGGRVIFVVENANNSEAGVYEWSGTGAPTLLDNPNSRDSLWVAGDYAIWSNGLSLFRRDLVTGETVTVSTNATNGGNEVDAAGDVVFTAETAYQSGNHQIYWYANGATVQLTNDATLWNVAPRFDGSNVVYLKETPCCSNQSTYAIWLYTGGSEVQLAQPSARLVWPAQDYQITAGYAAYVAPDSAVTLQVMLRDPSGSTDQVSDVGGAQSGAYPPHLVAVGADGSVAYSIANPRLRDLPPGTRKPMGAADAPAARRAPPRAARRLPLSLARHTPRSHRHPIQAAGDPPRRQPSPARHDIHRPRRPRSAERGNNRATQPTETGRSSVVTEGWKPAFLEEGRARPRLMRASLDPKVEGSNPSRPTGEIPGNEQVAGRRARLAGRVGPLRDRLTLWLSLYDGLADDLEKRPAGTAKETTA